MMTSQQLRDMVDAHLAPDANVDRDAGQRTFLCNAAESFGMGRAFQTVLRKYAERQDGDTVLAFDKDHTNTFQQECRFMFVEFIALDLESRA